MLWMKKVIIVLVLLLSAQAVQAEKHLFDASSLTLEGAKFIAKAATKKAKKEDWRVIIAITDANGNLQYLARMDGVQLASLDIAINKAKSAAYYGRPTSLFAKRIAKGETTLMTLPHLLPFAGGLPILVDGKVVGAIGVSGVKGHQDEQIAKAGVDAFSTRF